MNMQSRKLNKFENIQLRQLELLVEKKNQDFKREQNERVDVNLLLK